MTNEKNPIKTEMISEYGLTTIPLFETIMRNEKARRFILNTYNEAAYLVGGPKMADVISGDKESFKQARLVQQEKLLADVDDQYRPYYDQQSRYNKANFGIRIFALSVDKEAGYQTLLTHMATKHRKTAGELPKEITEQAMEDMISNDRAVNALMKVSDIGEFAITLSTPDRNKIGPDFDRTIRDHAFANFEALTGIIVKRKSVPKTE